MSVERPDWMGDAKCLDMSVDESDALFFPESGTSLKARRFCEGIVDRAPCPVRADCLDYSLETNSRFGVWGGVSERQRRGMHAAARREQRQEAI